MKMTKIFTIATLFSLSAAASAFAQDMATSFGTPAIVAKPSKNVTLTYTKGSDMTGTTGVLSYSITAIHASGTKTFGSTSGDTKIFMKDGITGNTVSAPAVSAGVQDSGAFSTWSAM